jgi:hypothetical protein
MRRDQRCGGKSHDDLFDSKASLFLGSGRSLIVAEEKETQAEPSLLSAWC